MIHVLFQFSKESWIVKKFCDILSVVSLKYENGKLYYISAKYFSSSDNSRSDSWLYVKPITKYHNIEHVKQLTVSKWQQHRAVCNSKYRARSYKIVIKSNSHYSDVKCTSFLME